MKPFLLFTFIAFTGYQTFAQTNILKGRVGDINGTGIEGAHVLINEVPKAITDSTGYFEIANVINGNQLLISHLSYDTLSYILTSTDFSTVKSFTLTLRTETLEEVTVTEREFQRTQAGLIELDHLGIQSVQSPFGDFTSVLATLPGVATNNELSTSYRVRGGNFDENLIYVNDIPIYRPQLISAGQQEGLSFVHTDMAREVTFSSGGWQARYGDKLSSVLNVDYKEPREFEGRVIGGLLGGSIYLGYGNESSKTSIVTGIRHKNARYLFNTFDTKGEYLPQFTDVQALLRMNLSSSKVSKLSILVNVANNDYEVTPETRETEFGAFGSGSLRFLVGFDGRQALRYNISQGGIKWDHQLSNRTSNQLIISGVYAMEREVSDLESGYRLCDVNTNIGSPDFNECVVTRGLGTEYDYTRNRLNVESVNIENRQSIVLSQKNEIEWGAVYTSKRIKTTYNEYEFQDSADFVQITEQITSNEHLRINGAEAYIQNQRAIRERHSLNMGFRINYQNLNNNVLFSPRLAYSYKPKWKRDMIFRFASGLYSQQPFLRELINKQGLFNRKVEPQSSLHAIAGVDYNFTWWSRPFKFLAEAYFKYLWNINPYDVENLRVRYYASNMGEGKVGGLDMRLSGEFIPGTESWFSLSLLSARENIYGDGKKFIRRPSDQRLLMSIVFQDHIPNDPTLRILLAFSFGSGFPFGPPDDFENRNIFKGEEYRRVDVGFSKSFRVQRFKNLEEISLRLEVLNLLGTSNAISYSWVQDFDRRSFAIPNNLSTRFLNFKLEAKF